MDWEFFITALTPGGVLLLCAGLYKKFPPKKINRFYGYRTRRSMKTQETWDFANRIGGQMLFYLSVSTLTLGFISYFTLPSLSVAISSFSLILGVIIGLWWCENKLIAHFDKDGRPLKPEL